MSNSMAPQHSDKPLRFAMPEYYRLLQEQMKHQHVHLFDIQATVVRNGEERSIILRYGEGFASERALSITGDVAEGAQNEELREFFQHTVDECKKTIIADYYRFMKSREV